MLLKTTQSLFVSDRQLVQKQPSQQTKLIRVKGNPMMTSSDNLYDMGLTQKTFDSKYKDSEAKMLVFFGAMVGHSMLMAMPHPMFLHPTFFKKISAIHRGEQLSEMADLKSIDTFEAQRLEGIL